MRIAVFGAAGRTGRHIAERALGHGHDVVALEHTTPLALSHARLTTVAGDVREFDAVAATVEGCDGVAFALSDSAAEGCDIHEAGIANVIHAMALHEVPKLVAISAAGAFARGDSRLSMGFRLRIATSMRAVYDDLEAMEMRIEASALDWTIVRPVGLTDDPATGHYRLSLDGQLLPKASRVSRDDVAALVVKALEIDTYDRRILVIAQ